MKSSTDLQQQQNSQKKKIISSYCFLSACSWTSGQRQLHKHYRDFNNTFNILVIVILFCT